MGEFATAADIYASLLDCRRTTEGSTSAATVSAADHLAEVHQRAKDTTSEDAVLRSAFGDCLNAGLAGTGALEACSKPCLFYQRIGDWKSAGMVWMRSLEKIWPSILSQSVTSMPHSKRKDAVDCAPRLALCLANQNDSARSKQVCVDLYAWCLATAGSDGKETVKIMREHASHLELSQTPDEAEKLYEEHHHCIKNKYGGSGSRTFVAARELARAYLRLIKSFNKAESIYRDILKIAKFQWGELHEATIEVSLALTKVVGRQKKNRSAEMLLAKLWASLAK